MCHAFVAWDLHDVRVAALVDEPFVIVQSRHAFVFGVRAALLHLLAPEVGAVAEVDGVVVAVCHDWMGESGACGCGGGC